MTNFEWEKCFKATPTTITLTTVNVALLQDAS